MRWNASKGCREVQVPRKTAGPVIQRLVRSPAQYQEGRQVCGRLGKLLQRDGAEPTVLAKFYHAVVQVVILFQAETCVLTETMSQRIEGAHMSF